MMKTKNTNSENYIFLLGLHYLPIYFCVFFISFFSNGQVYVSEGTNITISESTKIFVNDSIVYLNGNETISKISNVYYTKDGVVISKINDSEIEYRTKASNHVQKINNTKISLKKLAEHKKAKNLVNRSYSHKNKLSSQDICLFSFSNICNNYSGVLSVHDNNLVKNNSSIIFEDYSIILIFSNSDTMVYQSNFSFSYNLYNQNINRGPPVCFYL